MKKQNILFLLSIVLSITSFKSMKIFIYREEKDSISKHNKIILNKDTKFSNMCKNIITTYNNIGPNSFQIYSFCKNYVFFGINDELISKERPFCFTNIEKYFCHNRLDNLDIQVSCQERINNCVPISQTELILSILKGCVKENLSIVEEEEPITYGECDQKLEAVKIAKERLFKCPSLNKNYKINNIEEFCSNAEKRENFIDPNGIKVEYSRIKESDRENCKIVTEIYNNCIDSDNLLYPNSNYQRCFSTSNVMYLCSKLSKYTEEESNICANYILPVIAKNYLDNNSLLQDNEYCFDFENKILSEYMEFINNTDKEIAKNQNKFNDIEITREKLKELELLANSSLDKISLMNKKWLDFYPEMSTTYSIRNKLTESEYASLQKLRTIFDDYFPYSANLNNIIKDIKFTNGNFTNMIESMSAYITKSDDYSEILISNIQTYLSILEYNLNKTINNDDSIMISENIDKEEILSFQNEYMQIIAYNKNFLNYVVNKISETRDEINNNKAFLETTIKEIKFKSDQIKKKKDVLFELILK